MLEEAIASSPESLRKDPRGGGCDRDGILRHVIESNGLTRKIGVRHGPFEVHDLGALKGMREEIAAVLSRPTTGEPLVPGGWNARPYAFRRMAWHVVDHPWDGGDCRD
jgi:hypothetical protein